MAASKSSEVYVATDSGSCEIKGETFVYVKGMTRIRGNHALLKAVPDSFEPAEDHLSYDVEKATAGPGEKRGA